jgi:hypothetical protein
VYFLAIDKILGKAGWEGECPGAKLQDWAGTNKRGPATTRVEETQNAKPKCVANVTGSVLGPPVGRLKRTGRSASAK